MSSLVLDVRCGMWVKSTDCCSPIGNVTIVQNFTLDWKLASGTKYILQDGTVLTTPPAGLDCGCGAPPPPPLKIETEEFSMKLAPGVYNLASVLALAMAQAASNGKTKIHSIQFEAKEVLGGSFILDNASETLPAGSKYNAGNKNDDGTYLEEVSDFSLQVLNAGIDLNIVMF